MIQATFDFDQQNRVTKFAITGHADSGPYGQDIVCAAVSVTSLGTVNSLQSIAQIEPQVQSADDDGGLLVCAVNYLAIQDQRQQIVTETLMANCYQVLNSLVDNYGAFIQVKVNH